MMLRVIRTFGLYLVSVVACVTIACAQQSSGSKWQPGQYRGLVTGKSTTKDVVRVLGLPSWQGKPIEVPEVPGEEEWSYKLPTPQGECCDLFFKNGVLKSVSLRLDGMQSSEAERLFGPGFGPVRFSAKDDGSETGSSPICEDPKGDIVMLLNSEKGLSLSVDGRGVVQEAVYSDARPGSRHCSVKESRQPN
jgi:hypothetical protein